MKDYFGYEGKTCVVTGAASGMGLEATKLLNELGAEVYALDIAQVPVPVKKYVRVNLGKKESIDEAAAQLPPAIDKIFACAGVAGVVSRETKFTPVEVNLINFVGHRTLIELLIPRMPEGGAIAMIASIGGAGWVANIPTVMGILLTPGFEAAKTWLEANQENPQAICGLEKNRPYCFSKECLILYAKYRSWQLAERKIRINTLSPGNTATPLLRWFGDGVDLEVKAALSPFGRSSRPEEQAQPLIFLNSDMAGYISGADLWVDYALMGGVFTGQAKLGL